MLNISGIVLGAMDPLQEVVAHELFRFEVWGVEIVVSNHMFMVTLAVVILAVLLPLSVRGKGFVPRGFSNLIESICMYLREEVARPFLGSSTDKYIGFIWTLFFFILTLNLLGMIPLGKMISLITGKKNHLEGAATANIWIVGALAGIAFLAIHISGIVEQGLWKYIKNFIPKVPWWLIPFMYLIEVISALVKPVALAIRLFANIFAGHILIATLFMFVWIFKGIPGGLASVVSGTLASCLEIIVAFIQAGIFTYLTTIFIGFAIRPQH